MFGSASNSKHRGTHVNVQGITKSDVQSPPRCWHFTSGSLQELKRGKYCLPGPIIPSPLSLSWFFKLTWRIEKPLSLFTLRVDDISVCWLSGLYPRTHFFVPNGYGRGITLVSYFGLDVGGHPFQPFLFWRALGVVWGTYLCFDLVALILDSFGVKVVQPKKSTFQMYCFTDFEMRVLGMACMHSMRRRP